MTNEKKPQIKELITQRKILSRLDSESLNPEHLLKLSPDSLKSVHPADLAILIPKLSKDEQLKAFSRLREKRAIKTFVEMEESDQMFIATAFGTDYLIHLLELLPSDETADLLARFHPSKMDSILEMMDEDSRNETIELLCYKEDSAGGVMEKDLVDFFPHITVLKALELLRAQFEPSDFISYIYITNKEQKLLGVLSLKELILSSTESTLQEIMKTNIISVSIEDDQEKVAHLASKYSLFAIPVLNKKQQLVGIVTPADIQEIIQEEHQEDLYKMAGLTEDSDQSISPLKGAIYRFPWLLATVIGGLIAAEIIETQGQIEFMWLLSFSPLILGLAGNIAIQTSTIIIRNLSIHQFDDEISWKYYIKEAFTGLILALLCGLTLSLLISFIRGNSVHGITLGISLFAVILISLATSILIPLGFNKLKIDPAIASGPFVTTFIDVCGLFIYFQCAYYLLNTLS
ncbi:MAG: magnesium transporter [Candidatus Cloacimonadota bacterium]|nr:MAG: magnesium transporter [Candidatus Cloacimonadota bacterium]